tara:strand:- start:462 stop:854 length:393 start_codon:yes stop_codon:yes gene_type:complete
MTKLPCKDGACCYRKNRKHYDTYTHPTMLDVLPLEIENLIFSFSNDPDLKKFNKVVKQIKKIKYEITDVLDFDNTLRQTSYRTIDNYETTYSTYSRNFLMCYNEERFTVIENNNVDGPHNYPPHLFINLG